MTDPTTLHALSDRLREATRPDRELDAEIAAAFRIFPPKAPAWLINWDGPVKPHSSFNRGSVAVFHTTGKAGVNWKAEPYTASLDACAALQAERLPGWVKFVTPVYGNKIEVALVAPGQSEYEVQRIAHADERIAWLSAIVAAAIAEAESR